MMIYTSYAPQSTFGAPWDFLTPNTPADNWPEDRDEDYE